MIHNTFIVKTYSMGSVEAYERFKPQLYLFSFQNLKNQIMTTNMWVEQVSNSVEILHN